MCQSFFRNKIRGSSLSYGHNEHHLIQRPIEGSNDGSESSEIDRRNTRELVGKSIVKIYLCRGESSESLRYLRLRQTGKNGQGRDHLFLSAIEFLVLFSELETTRELVKGHLLMFGS